MCVFVVRYKTTHLECVQKMNLKQGEKITEQDFVIVVIKCCDFNSHLVTTSNTNLLQ